MNDICQLCHSQPETAMHMLAQCSFTRQIWGQLANWIAITLLPPPHQTSLHTGANAVFEAEQKFIYTVWNVWKERYRQIYDNKELNQAQLVIVIKLDVSQYTTARSKCLELQYV
jgi:hypothetical protein